MSLGDKQINFKKRASQSLTLVGILVNSERTLGGQTDVKRVGCSILLVYCFAARKSNNLQNVCVRSLVTHRHSDLTPSIVDLRL